MSRAMMSGEVSVPRKGLELWATYIQSSSHPERSGHRSG